MKIYINNGVDFDLLKTEILPSDTPTLDETLETFSFNLISNTNPLPFAPMQLIKVDFGEGASDLPTTYQQLEYIRATGSQYINTGYQVASEKLKIEFKCTLPSSVDGLSFFGSNDVNNVYDLVPYSAIGYGNRVFRHWVGNSSGILDIPYDETNDVTYSLNNGTLECEINGVTYTDTYTGSIITGQDFFIFGKNGNGSSMERGYGYTLYYLKIYDDDVLVKDLVPCYRKADGVIGLYDLVDGVFYTNDGSGDFEKGNEYDIEYFYIVSDSVDTYSLNPLRYKHSISCIQNTRKLSKHLVRNSVFSQPANVVRSSFNAESGYGKLYASGAAVEFDYSFIPSINWASEKLLLLKNEKIKNPKLTIAFQYAMNEGDNHDRIYYDNAHTTADILARATIIETLTAATTFTLKYKDANQTPQSETISASDFGVSVFDLNASYNFPRIKELADAGCNEFEVCFDNLAFLTGQYKTNQALNYPDIAYWAIQVQIVAETYLYSCYEVLNLLIERQKKETDIKALPALFKLPESGELYDLLNTTIAPNFAFTQLTMYECVAEVFRVFDAIFTLDENEVLGIEYFNNLDNKTITPKLTGRNLSLSEDKYTNGLVTYYQDGRVNQIFPDKERFVHLRSEEFGIPENQDHSFIVPHNIQSIIKCEIILDEFETNNGAWNVKNDNGIVVDITRFVLERDVWSTLDVGTLSNADYQNRIIKQSNSVYYVKGDNKIQVAFTFKDSWNVTHYNLYESIRMALLRMSGTDDQDNFEPSTTIFGQGRWNLMFMRLAYVSTVDGLTKIHSITNKYNGETLIDQANGAVDLNKLGLNMLGLSLKLGNPTLNATHKITSWKNRIKTGQLYEYEGGLWVANVVNYTFFNGYLQGKVSFVQNFNALALRTQILREKRMTNISKELIQKSEEVITDYIYYSSKVIDFSPDVIHFNYTQLRNLLLDSFKPSNSIKTISYAVIYDKNSPRTPGTNPGEYTRQCIYMPLVRYGAGNTINFELSFNHPISAGNKTDSLSSSSWLGEKSYYTTAVKYTDDNGFLETTSICSPCEYANNTSNKLLLGDEFPIMKIWDDEFSHSDLFFDIPNFKIYKQPNEILALNYQLAFIPDEPNTDFIGSQFINDNAFISEPSLSKNIYICFKAEKSSILDVKAKPYFLKKPITNITATGVITTYLNFEFAALTEEELANVVSWCLVDDEDNILFGSNRSLQSENPVNSVYICFVSSLSRH